jgi:hypothetical protein
MSYLMHCRIVGLNIEATNKRNLMYKQHKHDTKCAKVVEAGAEDTAKHA